MFVSSNFRYLHRVFRAATFVMCALLLNGCSLFGDEEEEDNQPTELVDFDETLNVDQLWSPILATFIMGNGQRLLVIAFHTFNKHTKTNIEQIT